MATRTIPERDRLEGRPVEDPMVDARERGTTEPRVVGHEDAPPPRVGRFGVATAGLLAVIVSAWGGILPYVGPIFGFSGDGTSSWHWSLPHSVLALVPGVAGVLLGLFVIGAARGAAMMRGRMTLSMAGVLLMACGAWFAIGPLAWPVIYHGDTYFVHTASHLRMLAYEVGYSIGTGLIVMGCGGFVSGWASRHQRRVTLATAPAEAAAPAAEPVESGI